MNYFVFLRWKMLIRFLCWNLFKIVLLRLKNVSVRVKIPVRLQPRLCFKLRLRRTERSIFRNNGQRGDSSRVVLLLSTCLNTVRVCLYIYVYMRVLKVQRGRNEDKTSWLKASRKNSNRVDASFELSEPKVASFHRNVALGRSLEDWREREIQKIVLFVGRRRREKMEKHLWGWVTARRRSVLISRAFYPLLEM